MFSQRSYIHSKTCRKYQNTPCQFNFGQFFTDRTMVAEPLSDDFSKEEKNSTLTRGADKSTILFRVYRRICREIANNLSGQYMNYLIV